MRRLAMVLFLVMLGIGSVCGAQEMLPLFPDGYQVAAYLDCGAAMESSDVLKIRQITGKRSLIVTAIDVQHKVARDQKALSFEVTGLNTEKTYALAFSWWDIDGKARKQSVSLGDTKVFPAAPSVAYYKDEATYARIVLPEVAQFAKDGSLLVTFNNEEGPNVMVSEVWLLERSETEARKRILIVTGDDYAGHLWRETAPELAEILREDERLEVTITESPYILGSPLLKHYDAVLLHFKNYAERLPLGENVWKGLEDYAASGKGVVVAHFGCGAMQEWDGFVNVVGRIWDPKKRGHDPYGTFKVRISDKTHPITREMNDFTTEDELYTCLGGDPAIQILCEATSIKDELDYPMGFVVPFGKGRIFHCPLGHDLNAFQSEGTRNLYRQAALWSVGLVE